jgi:hypothetical protein
MAAALRKLLSCRVYTQTALIRTLRIHCAHAMGLLGLRVATTVPSSRAGPQEAEIATSGSAPARPDHSAPTSATTVSIVRAEAEAGRSCDGGRGGVQAPHAKMAISSPKPQASSLEP